MWSLVFWVHLLPSILLPSSSYGLCKLIYNFVLKFCAMLTQDMLVVFIFVHLRPCRRTKLKKEDDENCINKNCHIHFFFNNNCHIHTETWAIASLHLDLSSSLIKKSWRQNGFSFYFFLQLTKLCYTKPFLVFGFLGVEGQNKRVFFPPHF